MDEQFGWIDDNIDKAAEGINKFRSIPVEILHREALKEYIVGVDNDITADLIYNLANCSKFEVIGVPHEFFRTYVVWTKFYGIKGENHDLVRAYGCTTWKLGQREARTAQFARRRPSRKLRRRNRRGF